MIIQLLIEPFEFIPGEPRNGWVPAPSATFVVQVEGLGLKDFHQLIMPVRRPRNLHLSSWGFPEDFLDKNQQKPKVSLKTSSVFVGFCSKQSGIKLGALVETPNLGINHWGDTY